MIRTNTAGTPPVDPARCELVATVRYRGAAELEASAAAPALLVESPAGYEIWRLTGGRR